MFSALLGQYKTTSNDLKDSQTKSIISTVLHNSMQKKRQPKVVADKEVRQELIKRMFTHSTSSYRKPAWRLRIAKLRATEH
jgi:hypothetical protein